MGRDLTVVVPGPCRTGCSFCPFPSSPTRSAAAVAADARRLLDENPDIEALFLLGSDLAASRSTVELLESVEKRDAPPRVYCYSTLRQFGVLPALRGFRCFAGVVLPVHIGEPTLQRDPVPLAEAISRAAVLESEGLSVFPHFLVHEAPAAEAGRVVDVLAKSLSTRMAFARVAMPAAAGFSRLAPALRALLDRASHHRIAVSFSEDAPPPCLDRLYADHPDAFSRVLAIRDGEPRRTDPPCSMCDLVRRCTWPGEVPGDSAEASRFSPVVRRERHVTRYDPDSAEDPRGVHWWVDRRELPECIRPWTTMEIPRVTEIEMVACNPDWLETPADAPGEGSLVEGWNGSHFVTMREAFLRDAIDEVCAPHCLLRARSRAELRPDERVSLSGRSDAFLRNQLLMHKEILAGVVRVNSLPTILRISPTFACNNRCRWCTGTDSREVGMKGETPEWLYERIGELLPTAAALHVSGPGEPLTSKRFLTFLRETDWSRLPDLEIQLTTNGTLLTAPLVDSLLDVPFGSIVVSLNAATPDVYRAVSGTDRFARVLENLGLLRPALSRFRHTLPALRLSFVAMSTNFRDLPAFLDIADGLGAVVILPPLETTERTRHLALWASSARLSEAQELIAAETRRWKRQPAFRQHLLALASSLERQAQASGRGHSPA